MGILPRVHIILAGGLFGFWLKRAQLSIFSPKLAAVYPLFYWAHAVALVIVIFLISALIWRSAVEGLLAPKTPSRWLAFHCLTYWILPLCACGLPLPWALRFFLALYFLLPALLAFHERTPLKIPGFGRHLWALAVLLAAEILCNTVVSPFSWSNPIGAFSHYESVQMGAVTPVHGANYVNAKILDASGFTHSYWGAASRTPTKAYSYGVAFLTWLLDCPAVDPGAFFRVVQILLFLWCVAAAFGFYLFLGIGLRLSYWTALAGGLLLLPANTFWSGDLKYFSPFFLGVFLTLPYALLCACAALRRQDARLSFAAGLVFCANFYILPSHPDSVFLGAGFLTAYAAVFCSRMFYEKPGFKPLILFLAFLLGLAGGSCGWWAPLLEPVLAREMAAFGHTDRLFEFMLGPDQFLALLKFSPPLAPLLLLGLFLPRKLFQDKAHFYFLWASLLAFEILLSSWAVPSGDPTALAALMFQSKRIQVYLVFLALIFALCGMEEVLAIGKGKFFRWGLLPCAALVVWAFFWGVREHRVDGQALAMRPHILLQTLVSNYRSLGFSDPASLRLMRDRLVRFGTPGAEQAPLGDILELSRRSYPAIDAHDAPAASRNPFYKPASGPEAPYAHKPDFNLGSVLASGGGRFRRIMPATSRNGKYAGAVAAGHFLHSADMGADTRFLAFYPTLQALYFLPGEFYADVGSYKGAKPWDLDMERVSGPLARKLFNIAGGDAYVFDKNRANEILAGKMGLRTIPYEMPKVLDPQVIVAEDERSYGMAYLASEVQYADPLTAEDQRMPPFRAPGALEAFRKSTTALMARLSALKKKHSVIIEDASRAGTKSGFAEGGGRMTIENIAGNKAGFSVRCETAPCVLVLNLANVGGWKAFSDAAPLAIQRANFAFMSVRVPAGEHFVWFEHRPAASLIGLWITLLSYWLGLSAIMGLAVPWPFLKRFGAKAFGLARVSRGEKVPGAVNPK